MAAAERYNTLGHKDTELHLKVYDWYVSLKLVEHVWAFLSTIC